MASVKHIGVVFAKIILWLLIFLLGLIVLIVIALQFPRVQHFLAQQGASYLSNTLDTRVDIGGFTTDWRNTIVLKDVYVEDQQQDTLWHSERLGVDMGIWGLIRGELNIAKVDLDNATVKLHIREDSTTNFDFITEAFATDTAAAQPADTSAAMPISIDIVNLNNIYLVFDDDAGGNYIRGRIGELVTTTDELNLDEERYLVDEIRLRNTRVDYVQTKPPPPEEEPSEPLEMEFGLNRVALENLQLSYLSRVSEQSIMLNLGQSELIADNIDLPNAEIDLTRFDLHNTSLSYVQEKYKPTDSLTVNPARTARELDETVEETQGQPVNWLVRLSELNISGVEITSDNKNVPEQPRGMDFDHLAFRDVELQAEDIVYSMDRAELSLNQMQLVEKSGFRVNNFQADITFDSTHARLANLDLQTGHSSLQKDLAVRYTSIDALTERPEHAIVDLDIDNTRIGMRDLLYFSPELADDPSFRSVANAELRMDARARGPIGNVTIDRLQLAGLQGTNVDVSGNVRNAMDPDNLYLDLNINRFATTRTDIQALAPPGTLPPDFRLPNNISMTGSYTGSLTQFDARADINTSFGNLNAVVDMAPGPEGAEPFRATVSTPGFDLGQLMAEDMGLGTVSMSATARGAGLDPETMRADVEAVVREFNYNDYAYNNIRLDATIDRNLYNVNATSTDENIAFNLDGEFNLRNSERPAYAFNLDLQGVDLQALNLYEDDLTVQGQLSGNFTGADLNTLNGTLDANQLVVRHQEQVYPIDTLQLALNQSDQGAEVLLASNIMAAHVLTNNRLDSFATAVEKHFSNYFDLHPDPPYPANLSLNDFEFEIVLRNTAIISSFVPGLEQLQPTGPIRGSYNSQTQQFAMDANFSQIAYTDYDIRNLGFQVRGDEAAMGYHLGIGRVNSPSFLIENISLDGEARDDNMSVRLAVAEDTVGQDLVFVLGGQLTSTADDFRFSFAPDQVVINGDQWTVPQDNFLQFGSDILYANNIRLQRNNSFFALNSQGPVAPNAPLQVEFGNFEIGYLLESFQPETDTLLITGTINGEATIRNIMEGTLAFTSDIAIDNLAYTGVPVGNLAVQANSAGENRYNLDARLTGNNNQVIIAGFYEAQPNANLLNLNANIASLNLASLQGFTQGMVEDMDGQASGRLSITGTLDDPNINGQLNFNQAQFNISMLNSIYQLQDERLVFNEQGINFPNFTLTDTTGGTLVVNGNILTQDYTDFRFGLDISTDRFLAMNSTAEDNDLFYGTVYMAANAAIRGDLAQPEVNVKVSVLEGSDFTAVVPADEAGAAEREGIVEFVTLNESLTAIVNTEKEDSTQVTGFVGADIQAQITVTDETPITIVIDPTTGDNLVVRGTADPLLIAIAPSGQITMTGRYEISEGRYSMDFFDLASRELDIAEGSFITWTGDPMMAIMQITAIYRVQTAPRELVEAQAGGVNSTDPALRNQLPFEVFVNVEGELLTPEISFNIELPERHRGAVGGQVATSLGNLRQDESELNKQVFALLVLGRFLAPDPLASSGGGLESTARNSLSQVMTDQLNQLTERYAGGLGLELGVNSYQDYSGGSPEGRTDLNVAVRQQFLNDRLTVRVGTDIGLEGQSERNSTMSGFGGDVSVEYSITEDGRLRVQAFQRNQFEDYLEGDVRATGAGIIYVRDYNNFSDLFRNLERRREREAERRRAEAERLRSQQQSSGTL